VIRQARARIFGSAGLVGPVSWLMQTIEGRPYEEACEHDPDEVLGALAEGNGHAFPPAVQRGADFAVKALRRALGIAVHGMPADIDSGILVCRCIGVGDRAIRAAIRAGARDPESIGEATGACTGCRSCRPDLMALIDEETRESLPLPDEALHPAARICMATAGPVLRALGLPLEAAVVEEGAVRIRLGTPRADCCISPPGAVAVARQLLRDTVAEDTRVELLD
jgi:bacterioferritin-associated ferredoxin